MYPLGTPSAIDRNLCFERLHWDMSVAERVRRVPNMNLYANSSYACMSGRDAPVCADGEDSARLHVGNLRTTFVVVF
jgi:hypothetical protein